MIIHILEHPKAQCAVMWELPNPSYQDDRGLPRQLDNSDMSLVPPYREFPARDFFFFSLGVFVATLAFVLIRTLT